jgi:zinc protease
VHGARVSKPSIFTFTARALHSLEEGLRAPLFKREGRNLVALPAAYAFSQHAQRAVNSGLTYGARSEFETLAQTGTFAISSFTALPKTEPALDLALKTYQRLWDKGIDAATLDSAKAYVKGQFRPRFETSVALSGFLGEMFVSDVGRAQIDNFMKDVDSLNPARAKLLVDKHFPRNNLQMVLIGQAASIRKIAAKYGDVTELEISDVGFAPRTN